MESNNPGQEPQVRLVGLSDPYKGQVFVIDKEEFIIGRAATSDLSMPQSTISGRHAKIQKVGDHYEILDLQSTNGTFLNGIKVERKHLRSEDTVKFDQFEFQFIDPADISRTIIRPAPKAVAKTSAREPIPVTSSYARTSVMKQELLSKKGSLLGGVIVGLLVSFLLGLAGNAVVVLLAAQQVGFSAQNFAGILKSMARTYPLAHIPQVWLKQNWSDWRTIVSLALIALAVIVGGILVQAIGKKARAASAFIFSLLYVIVAVLIQMMILKFSVQSLPGEYPSLGQSLTAWPNFALSAGLFFAVVLVLSFIGTLIGGRPKISA
jgi:hypothetical protein